MKDKKEKRRERKKKKQKKRKELPSKVKKNWINYSQANFSFDLEKNLATNDSVK